MATKGVAEKMKPAVKKAAPAKAKPAAAKPAAKKAAAKKAAPVKAKPAAAKAVNKKGTKYRCNVCGLVVSVDTVCNCVELCDLVCCSKPMQVVKK
ncbi:MAG: hypothetical protein A4E61_00916 [Syntrophorhabdus sp. PtaB.Bin184]|jgi:rubrerythrin|nr:MAG: hypothetical protein A4E61_00916 [Syntrophorhabdus sp. PtaB.Bin184]